MFIVIMILIGYIIYMVGFIKSYRDPSNDTSPFLYLTILLVCIAIGLVINLIVIERVNYETALINTRKYRYTKRRTINQSWRYTQSTAIIQYCKSFSFCL